MSVKQTPTSTSTPDQTLDPPQNPLNTTSSSSSSTSSSATPTTLNTVNNNNNNNNTNNINNNLQPNHNSYHLNPPTLQLPAGVSGSSTTLSSLNALNNKSIAMTTTSKESFYLTILCIYKGVILAIFAILAIVRDRDYVAAGCICGLFACILFLQGLRKELIPILRLFQFVFAILCAYFTVNFLIETVRVFKGATDIRYIVFPVWILLIFPTVLTVYFLQRHIDFIVETLPAFPDDV